MSIQAVTRKASMIGKGEAAPRLGGQPSPLTAGSFPARLQQVLDRLTAAAPTNIGYPVATDDDYQVLAPFLAYLLNNMGTAGVDPTYPNHVKDLERDVLGFFADLFRAPNSWDGYVTSGGSEANLYALWLARTAYPDGVVYSSTSAHYSAGKAAHLLGMTTVKVTTTLDGQIDYGDLRRLAAENRDRAAIVVATIGTTMTEAVDDVHRIHDALDKAGIADRYVHSDAALAGIPLAFTRDRPAFDLADGADSIAVSGHKFLGTPWPSSVMLTGATHTDHDLQMITYTGSPDGTITGSRNGHAVVALWLAVHRHGRQGLRRRVEHARQVAEYTSRRLAAIGWPTWRNPRALTVMLRPPPPEILTQWPLATDGGWSHLICMPGVTHNQIDRLIQALQNHDRGRSDSSNSRPAPVPDARGADARLGRGARPGRDVRA